MEDVFKQIMFLQSERPLNVIEQTILALHAVNVHNGLKLVGLVEEDVEQDYEGLPEGWDHHESGVYSLKYRNHKQETFQFKYVTHRDSPWLNVFVMKLSDQKRLCSTQIDTSKLKFDRHKQLFENQEIKNYQQEVLAILKEEKKEPEQQQQLPNQQRPQGMFWDQPRNNQNIQPDPSNFGRSDLDPFFRGGLSGQSGNLMGPSYFQNQNQRQQQQPDPDNPLLVPPGARFDPYGPHPSFNPNIWDQQNPRGGPRGGGNSNFPF